MKRKIISLLIILIICVCVGLQFTYADTINNKIAKSTILSSPSLEITKNTNFTLDIDLTKITFENFKIELSSNINLETPTLENTLTQTDDKLNSNVSVIPNENTNLLEIVANKSDLNLTTLTLNYTLPKTIEVGNSVQFVLKATSTEEGEDVDTTVIEDSIVFTVVENIKDTNNDNNSNNNGDNSNNNNSNNPDTSSGNSNVKPSGSNSSDNSNSDNKQSFSVNLNTSNSGSTSKSSTQISGMNTTSANNSNTQTITYDGSSNNYLSNLEVEGYTFSNTFSKTTSTYFITIPEATTSLNINASTEDSAATICVYGDSDLTSGSNKILINVTAENGSVRTYRIFATVK